MPNEPLVTDTSLAAYTTKTIIRRTISQLAKRPGSTLEFCRPSFFTGQALAIRRPTLLTWLG
jgi:hypothetical protein